MVKCDGITTRGNQCSINKDDCKFHKTRYIFTVNSEKMYYPRTKYFIIYKKTVDEIDSWMMENDNMLILVPRYTPEWYATIIHGYEDRLEKIPIDYV